MRDVDVVAVRELLESVKIKHGNRIQYTVRPKQKKIIAWPASRQQEEFIMSDTLTPTALNGIREWFEQLAYISTIPTTENL